MKKKIRDKGLLTPPSVNPLLWRICYPHLYWKYIFYEIWEPFDEIKILRSTSPIFDQPKIYFKAFFGIFMNLRNNKWHGPSWNFYEFLKKKKPRHPVTTTPWMGLTFFWNFYEKHPSIKKYKAMGVLFNYCLTIL